MGGRLDEARALAQRYTDSAESQQPGRAIGEVLVAYVAIAQGDFGAAVALLERAADALAPTGYSWGPLSLMLLAQARGQQGDQIGAAKALSAAESRHGMKSALFTPELALAGPGRRPPAVTCRRRSTRPAMPCRPPSAAGSRRWRCARCRTRSGSATPARSTARSGLAGEVDCVLGRLTLAHAQALTDGDAIALKEVAEELAAIGLCIRLPPTPRAKRTERPV